ncbi:MAG: MgtC/SapB family protein [Deltaproteobacteria bacterium]|nr:MgtC/SapB family protein [Deltaproteobacteria bacterium]
MDFIQQVLLADLDYEVFLRMGLAVVLGGLIGLEREQRSRPAGLRTLIIVCLGATMIMIVSTKLPAQFFSGPGEAVVRVDPGRIAAGIVTGIGFLGAGVVLKLGDIVRGVTTAACIWFVAALGIAIGEGHYALSILATITVLFVLWMLHYVEIFFRSNVYPTVTVKVQSEHADAAVDSAKKIFGQFKGSVKDLKACVEVGSDETLLCFSVKMRQHLQAHDVVKKLQILD